MKNLNFTALDFETMTPERSSACAIGVVKVIEGVIVAKFYTLLKPIPDDRTTTNSKVNGITKEMLENAPTFGEAWTILKDFIEGHQLVAHSKDFDLDVLDRQFEYYNIPTHINSWEVKDTYAATGLPLEEACSKYHIHLENHHDALSDATACAEVALALYGITVPVPSVLPFAKHSKAKEMKSETKQPLSADEVENKTTSFFQKKVVFTGNLESYPQRDEIASLLRKYGADINSSISRKTNVVIVGEGAGPSKMKKIGELQDAGYDIRVIYEDEFLKILKDEGIA